MASALYQTLSGAAIGAGAHHWRVHIEGMVSTRGVWIVELALIGQPGYTLKLRVPRLDHATAVRALARLETWVAQSNRVDGETIAVDWPNHETLSNVDLQPRDWSAIDPDRPVVLIVDDIEDHLRLYEETLSDRFTVLKASNGPEGIAIARVHHPSIVLLDVMMPGMDGWEVCQHLRATPATARTPIIILSASAASDVPERARAVGAAAVLTKPYVVDRLERTIDAVLAQRTNL